MIGRMSRGLTAFALALVALPLVATSDVQAQQSGPFRVLVPDFFAMEDANRNFGRDMAKELRELMRVLPGYTAIERDEIRDNLRRLDLDMEDLNCLTTRQLGPQINAQVAICASYVEQDRNRAISDIQIVDIASGQILRIDDAVFDRDEEEEAAQYIIDAFDNYVQQSRFRAFCFDYSSEQNELWDDALRACTQALELNPEDNDVRYQIAYVHYQMGNMEEALVAVEDVLEADPINTEALNLGGFIATSLGNVEQGRRYYSEYLQLNPGDVDIRRNIAYRQGVEAGDPLGAVAIIQEGLETVPESVPLRTDLANYSFAAARSLLPEGFQPSEENPVPPEVAELYDQAIEAYLQVFEVRGDSMEVGSLRNVIVAQVQMNRLEDAAATSETVLEIFPGEAVIWATYADALRRLGRVDEAVAAYQEIETLDPNYPNLYARQGQILVQADRRDDAVPILKRAVERGADPNQMSRIIFADAYSKGIQPEQKRWDYALDGILHAKSFEGLNEASQAELDFWHGYTLYSQGIQVQAPSTVQSAERALPLFRQAKDLLTGAGSYAQQRNINLQEILGAADQYIEIQDAIIRRGG